MKIRTMNKKNNQEKYDKEQTAARVAGAKFAVDGEKVHPQGTFPRSGAPHQVGVTAHGPRVHCKLSPSDTRKATV